MFNVVVNLENRQEYIPFFGKWAAVQVAKKIGKCVDVVEAMVVDTETGEIIIHYVHQECVWCDGFGEL